MKEIECPACGEMIPADSKYCDMCGAELLECVNCGTLGTDMFCPECGKPMVARKPDASPETTQPQPVKPAQNDDDGGKTIGRPAARKDIVLKARKGGFILRPEDEAVIGRKDSPYSDILADCDLISRRHGKFLKRGRDWYIMDFGSTNGTYVNNREAAPDTPVKINAGDVVDIGTYIFDVIER
ncbi:MAG: FHA domain-containing protein [Muribaculaceae bacterium]|nr:FHA domain-containing protein [Muribaculaceae bacterium]